MNLKPAIMEPVLVKCCFERAKDVISSAISEKPIEVVVVTKSLVNLRRKSDHGRKPEQHLASS